MANRPRKSTGTRRMTEQGYQPVQLWLSPQEVAVLKKACRQDHGRRIPLATFTRQAALREAQHLLNQRQRDTGSEEPPEGL